MGYVWGGSAHCRGRGGTGVLLELQQRGSLVVLHPTGGAGCISPGFCKGRVIHLDLHGFFNCSGSLPINYCETIQIHMMSCGLTV